MIPKVVGRYSLLNVAWLLATSVFSLPSQTKDFKIGDRLPPLKVSQVFQGFPDATLEWSTLRGKVIVLEFWATWCVPCVEAIPHLNKLADELSSEPVVFISVSVDDEPERVSDFLKRMRISGWVASADADAPDEFAIISYPQTYVLDREGKVAAVTLPDSLNVEAIQRVLAGQPANVLVKDISTPNLNWDLDGRMSSAKVLPEYEVIVEKTERENCGISFPIEAGSFIADGCDAKLLLPLVYQADFSRVIFPSTLTSAHYRVAVRIPNASSDEVLAVTRKALSTAIGFTGHWEHRNVEVYVLEGPSKPSTMLKLSHSQKFSGLLQTDSVLKATGDVGLRGLCTEFLEPKLQSIVVNRTRLSGAYDWGIRRDADTRVIVERDLGLRLTRTTQRVKLLVVEPAADSSRAR